MAPATGQAITVLVADRDVMVGHLLAGDLRRYRQLRVLDCSPDTSSIIASVTAHHPDVLLVCPDLLDGPLTALRLLKQLRRLAPHTRGILLLENCRPRMIAECFRAGAKGIFNRSQYDAKRLCRCIACVAAGQIWANSEQIGFVLEVFVDTASMHVVDANGQELLTRREQDVVRLVAEGLGNREVAQQLGLSEHTVKNYLFNVFEKLGISSRSELVMLVIANSRTPPLAGPLQPGEEASPATSLGEPAEPAAKHPSRSRILSSA